MLAALEKREQKTLLRYLRQYLNQEIHLKIDGEDAINIHALIDVGKDYVIVTFAHMERIIPLNKITYFQIGVPNRG